MGKRTETTTEATTEATAEAATEAAAEAATEAAAQCRLERKVSSARRSTAATEEEMTRAKEEAHGLLHDCDRSARYHTARRAFLDTCHRWMMVGVLVSGSAAIATLYEAFGLGAKWAPVLMLVPTVVGAISVVWGLTNRARDHELLARRFYELAKRINVYRADDEAVEAWRVGMLDICRDEPAVFHALNAECGNAATQALGHDEHEMQRIQWWQRALRHWWRFSAKDFPKNGGIAT